MNKVLCHTLLAISAVVFMQSHAEAGLIDNSMARGLDRAYNRALADSAVMKSKNIRQLHPITTSKARFVVWTDYPGYLVNSNYVFGRQVYVSRSAEMKKACRELPRRDLNRRINELLGLPATPEPRRFVEISMDVDQPNNANLVDYSNSSHGQAIFRPCSDPNVKHSSCGFDFADDVNDAFKNWIYHKTRETFVEKHTDAHSGRVINGYPWTDLGYTYNWAPGQDKFGVEEFVIKSGAVAEVVTQADGTAYVDASEFCQR